MVYVCVCARVHVHVYVCLFSWMPKHMGRSEENFENQFSPSTICVLGTNSGHQAWQQASFPDKLSCLPYLYHRKKTMFSWVKVYSDETFFAETSFGI